LKVDGLNIDGGFLQYGSNSSEDPSALISETDVKCILISPNYRLGILGFLASKELCSNPEGFEANFGFWDQRLALEWTYENISAFGGNKGNITVGGLSAGSYSAFHQLAHDIGRQNCDPQIIRRVFLWSNGCGVEPKPLDEAQDQFNELLMHLNIPLLTPATVKLDALRTTPVGKLMQAVEKLNCKFSRPIMDHNFISETLFPDIYSGKFGARLKELGIQIMIGDLTQEYHLYKFSYPPKSFSQYTGRLCWDYPKKIVDAICKPYMGVVMTEGQWAEVFGKLYADMQIHSTMRGLIDCIVQTLPSSQIYRYRIDWRTRSVDKRIPKALGATHATDLSIWFFGNGEAPMEQEKEIIKIWLKPVAQFLQGKGVTWGTNGVKQVRYLTNEGKIEIRDDEVWDAKLPLWKLTQHITSPKVFREAKL
jgi:carboxylesterase type B